jgi:hypothetical protein
MATAPRNKLLRKRAIGLQTRLANEIVNDFDPTNPGVQDVRVCSKWGNDHQSAIRRTVVPSYGYNCHGLTFAARRTQVWLTTEVQHILREDGYDPVSISDALPGDIAVYYSRDEPIEIEHSAIVVERAKKNDLRGPLVVSKWGRCEEYIHYYRDCPYPNVTVKFFRMPK